MMENLIEHFRQRSEVFGKSSEIIRSGWDIFGNPGQDETKISHIIFDSEKVGKYINLCTVNFQAKNANKNR